MTPFNQLKKTITSAKKNFSITSSGAKGLLMDIHFAWKEGKITKEQRDELVWLLKSK